MKQPIKELVCICCPLGCDLQIEELNGEYLVTGNRCPRGKTYAINELTAPTRMVTGTVRVVGGIHANLPVKTDRPVAKSQIMEVAQCLTQVRISAPVRMGDVLIENVANTGANIVATKTDLGKPDQVG